MTLFVQLATSLPDDPRLIEAGPMAELVYYRSIMRCRDALSNGVIHRARLVRWFDGIPRVERQLNALVDVGLLEMHDDGWCIPERADDAWQRAIKRRRWAVYQRRDAIFTRDGHACVECGATTSLEVDHIVPMSRGGTDDDENLQTLCKPCNSSKKDRV